MRQLLPDLALVAVSALLAAGIILCWVLWLEAQPVCTAYASNNGSGSTCSEPAPCTIGTWLSQKAAPGGVLCLHDGTYTGDQGMLQFSAKSGTAGSPITVRAMTDGAVTIDGQHNRRPLDCNASYITVQGVGVANGNDTTLVLRGQHCTVQRVVAWADAPDDGAIENVCDIGGAHNLLEDSACFGYARKSAALGARGGNGPNTIRRTYLEFHGAPAGSAQGNPTNVLEIGYGQSNVTAENVIVRRNVLSSATEPEAPIMVFQTHGSALLGSIAFAAAQDTVGASRMMDIVPDAGSSAGSGFVTSNMLAQDVAILVDPAHTGIKAWQITGGNGSTGNVAKRLLAVAPQGAGTCTGEGWSCTEMYGGTTLSAALGSKNLWDTFPGLCKRVVNRQVTDVGLWPLPITARVQAALGQARLPQRNILADVEARLGTIPAQCRSSEGPVPPTPGPGVPVPPTQVQAVLQGSRVLVHWTDLVNENHTGYTVERKVGTGSYAQLSAAPGPEARTYLDTAPVAGSQNCYVVYTRSAIGPSGFSTEACVQVPGPPRRLQGSPGVYGNGRCGAGHGRAQMRASAMTPRAVRLTSWQGCYRDGWQALICPDAFAHPAKYARGLIHRLYRHLIEQGYVRQGETVLDPFGGVALGALDAMTYGLRWVGVELEPRFVDLGRENLALWERRYGYNGSMLLQGDSRHLRDVVGAWALQAIIASPPLVGCLAHMKDSSTFDFSIMAQNRTDKHGRSGNPGDLATQARLDGQRLMGREYGTTPGQLGAMPPGSISAVVSSPPYAGAGHVLGTHNGIDYRKVQEGGTTCTPARQASGEGYGHSVGQLGAMPAGRLACVSSPPYAEGLSKEHTYTDHAKRDKDSHRRIMTEKGIVDPFYGVTPGQLGTDTATFWAASAQIMTELAALLPPGAVCAWVLKAYVKDKQIVPFPDQWRQLCEAHGFETREIIHASLIEEQGTQATLFGSEERLFTKKASFFRRLAEKRGSPSIDYEVILLTSSPP